MAKSCKVLVLCGGSNGNHVLAADIGRRGDWVVRLVTSRPESWSARVHCTEHRSWNDTVPLFLPTREVTYSGELEGIYGWDDAPRALRGADAVVLTCPVRAHRSVLEKVLPALDRSRPVVVGSLYAQGGFDWIVRDLLARRDRVAVDNIAFFGLKRFPFLCKATTYGASVTLFGRFSRIVTAVHAPTDLLRQQAVVVLGELFRKPVSLLPSFLCCTLNLSNQILHPAIGWGHFHDYVPGHTTYPRRKLFYGECTPRGMSYMFAIYRDIRAVAGSLEAITGLSLVEHLGAEPMLKILFRLWEPYLHRLEALRWIELTRDRIGAAFIRGNKRLNRALAPMKPAADGVGFVPDFGSRFWLDDIGHGLCVVYGIGQILGIETPAIETMIRRHQAWMGKQFLAEGGFGADLNHTNAPQYYGVKDPESLKSLIVW